MKMIHGLILAATLIVGGCAHPIVLTPDADRLPVIGNKRVSENIVGYYFSDEERQRKVVTAGGGGDKVEYSPYKELEPGIYRVLNNLFKNVYVLKNANDSAFISEKNIHFVFRPQISTNSSSSSLITWPPTDFEIIIEISAVDTSGKTVWKDIISGKGKAEYDEFKNDFSLAARRASEHVLSQLQEKLLASPVMH